MPRDARDDGAADERAEGDREAADPAPRAEREAAPLGRDRGREDRQRERHHDRAAEALHGAGDVERADRRRERGRGGGDGEDREADREHPPAAEAVAERGAGEQQHGEGQRVGVDRPLEAADAGVEVVCGSPAAPS